MYRIRNLARKWRLYRIYQAVGSKFSAQKSEVDQMRLKFPPGTGATIDLQSAGGISKVFIEDAEEQGAVIHSANDIAMIKQLMNHAPETATVWDVGANIGVYTVIFASIVGDSGKVVSFEPENKSRTRLIQNIEINHLKTVTVLPIALGNQDDDEASLSVDFPPASGTHRIGSNASTKTETISIVTGDHVLQRFEISPPNIIKIDVEGYEEMVLLGIPNILESENLRAILCEVHFRIFSEAGNPHAPSRIKRLLKSKGFKIKWLDPSHLLAYR